MAYSDLTNNVTPIVNLPEKARVACVLDAARIYDRCSNLARLRVVWGARHHSSTLRLTYPQGEEAAYALASSQVTVEF